MSFWSLVWYGICPMMLMWQNSLSISIFKSNNTSSPIFRSRKKETSILLRFPYFLVFFVDVAAASGINYTYNQLVLINLSFQ